MFLFDSKYALFIVINLVLNIINGVMIFLCISKIRRIYFQLLLIFIVSVRSIVYGYISSKLLWGIIKDSINRNIIINSILSNICFLLIIFISFFLFRLFDHVINNSEYQEMREEENS